MANSNKGRRPAPTTPRNGSRRPAGRTNVWSTSDRMLIVDSDGDIKPLNNRFASTWPNLQAGKLLPINQRFARMWEIPRSVQTRLEDENALRHALEAEELIVYYQPQFSVKTGLIVGAEALLRWQHPSRGLVLPNDFIPLAEETGAIVPIGEWVLQTACAQNKRWQDQGLTPITVAVNVSPLQFREPSLLPMIEHAITRSGLDPEWLELEITEMTAMQNVDLSASTIRNIAQIGSRVSVDDFGSGYCSLGYLKKFALHTLKIDQSFVRGVATDPNDAAIAEAILALASALNLEVIAEGVETDDQLSFFSNRNCHRIQGFRLGKPMTADDLARLLKRPVDSGDTDSRAADRR